MHFTINNQRQSKPFALGTDRSEVRNILANAIFRTKSTEPENDFYLKEGLILGYDGIDKLEFIEIFPPSTAEFLGVRFFDSSLPSVLNQLQTIGLVASFEFGCYRYDAFGLSLFCPENKIESVSLFRKGYYS